MLAGGAEMYILLSYARLCIGMKTRPCRELRRQGYVGRRTQGASDFGQVAMRSGEYWLWERFNESLLEWNNLHPWQQILDGPQRHP